VAGKREESEDEIDRGEKCAVRRNRERMMKKHIGQDISLL
jgi:hypothetical protein